MSQPASIRQQENPGNSWHDANRDYLNAEMSRLRLILQLRVLWLRKQWKRDPLQEFREWVVSDAEADRLLAASQRESAGAFYESDAEAVKLGREILDQRDIAMAAAERANASGGPPAMEILARVFRLTDFDREVLLLSLAPELNPAFERLFAYVQDDATLKFPTTHLAFDLFGERYFGAENRARGDGWQHFIPEAPLFRSRLIRLERSGIGSGCAEALRIERRICDYLLGINRLDDTAARVVRLLETTTSNLKDPAAPNQLERLLRSWNGRGRMPAVNLFGKAASCRVAAVDLCTRLGVGIYQIELARLPGAAQERHDLLRVLERDAVLLPCAFFVDLTEVDRHDRTASATAEELVLDLGAFLIIASRESWRSERALISVAAPNPSTTEQLAAWKSSITEEIKVLHHAGIGDTADKFFSALVQQFDFTLPQIHQVSDASRAAALLRDGQAPAITTGDLWTFARAHFSDCLRGLADRIVPAYDFEDLVLPNDTLQQLREIADQVCQRAQVYDRWGFGERLSRGRGIAALFAGPSGTGKTMAAEVLAKHLNLDLYRVDLAGVVSKYIGETEKNLRQVFDAAEQSGAILFFDEADALFGKRSEVRDSHDRFANIEINYLLQRMEDYRGLAILATNMKSLLDQAFLRRLRFLVDFPFPSTGDRLRIWRGVFPAKAETAGVDYAFLSRLEIAGGNIKNIAINAAFLAASHDQPIGMSHLLNAARREYAKIDKLVLESEFGRYYRAVYQ
jgi:hypothetical protein